MLRRLTICAIAALLTAPAAFADETIYYAVRIDGQKVGHATHTRRESNGKVSTTKTMHMALQRVGVAMSIDQTAVHVETADGKPLSFRATMKAGPMPPQITVAAVKNGVIEATISAGANIQTVEKHWPTGALMSEGIYLLSKQKGLTEGTTYDLSIFEAEGMMALPLKVTVGKSQPVDLFGRVVSLTPLHGVMSSPMGDTTMINYVDSAFRDQRTVMTMMGMELELVACPKEFALSPNDLVDIVDKSLITSPAELSAAARRGEIVYHLTPREGKTMRLPSDTAQSAAVDDSGDITVAIRPTAAPDGIAIPYHGDDEAGLEALKPSQYVQSDNEAIVALARKAVGDAKDAATTAKRLEAFVREYVSGKSLSVGYASAVEVAESRQGDCTEHAVLLAALCRAIGIPADVVQGIVYIDTFAGRSDVFVGHQWVRVLIGEKWVHLDAALSGYDSGHIMLSSADGPGEFMQVLGVFGAFEIKQITDAKGKAFPAAERPATPAPASE
ncbi:MAG: transglutaminase-like domain-containing protein [Planctomycetota bacterium]|jgi:hypothetical protein